MCGVRPDAERDVPPEAGVPVVQHFPIQPHLVVRRLKQLVARGPVLQRTVVRDERRRHVQKVRPELHLALAMRNRAVWRSRRIVQQVI